MLAPNGVPLRYVPDDPPATHLELTTTRTERRNTVMIKRRRRRMGTLQTLTFLLTLLCKALGQWQVFCKAHP